MEQITLERDGFKVRRKTFTQPANTALADPATKRRVTICNLFANHRLSLADIVRVLDEDLSRVVAILIEQGLVYDRRKTRRGPAQSGRTMLRKY
jgi:hypothetical protein